MPSAATNRRGLDLNCRFGVIGSQGYDGAPGQELLGVRGVRIGTALANRHGVTVIADHHPKLIEAARSPG